MIKMIVPIDIEFLLSPQRVPVALPSTENKPES
jgi:hypothetical protein